MAMAGSVGRTTDSVERAAGCALEEHQLAAVVDPRLPIQSIAADDQNGSFQDLERLIDQLGTAPIFELGKPLPLGKFQSRERAGSCHASHNRALFGEGD